jgi:PIN domain nuclease of toxin-antitoxin system
MLLPRLGCLRIIRNPFDRMLIAQAQSEHMILMTADRMFSKYKVDLLWSRR